MLRQYFEKQAIILRGALYTYLMRRRKPAALSWWDERFYTSGLSDARTLSPTKSPVIARYHYASVELLILRHIANHGVTVDGASVLDIGSGAGHWIDFYLSLGASCVTGVDVSQKSATYLREKYADNPAVEIHLGQFQDCLEEQRATYDFASAIGVMFHVIDDGDWRRGLRLIADSLCPGGLFVAGGHFGLVTTNAVFDGKQVTKRLRSRRMWQRELRAAGFSRWYFYRNRAYLHIGERLTQNDVLVAVR